MNTTYNVLSLDILAEFVWGFGQNFLLIVRLDNKKTKRYVWSNPDYGGDNTLHKFKGYARNFTSKGFCGRDKGTHSIRKYCGENVVFVDC